MPVLFVLALLAALVAVIGLLTAKLAPVLRHGGFFMPRG